MGCFESKYEILYEYNLEKKRYSKKTSNYLVKKHECSKEFNKY